MLGPDSAQLLLGSVKTSFLWGWHDPFLLGSKLGPVAFMASQDLDSSRSRLGSAVFVVGQDSFLWGWQDPFLLWSRLGLAAFRSGQDPFVWG